MRRLVAAGACVLILTACGDAGLLDGVGDRTGGFVHGNTTTTTTLPTVPAGQSGEAVVEASDVMWFNDGKISNASGEPDEVIAAVWASRVGLSRFVQSSRTEIAAALPGIEFPAQVPEQVRWVTSQLVYREDLGVLDTDTSAAFGLWTTDPYQSDAGRIAVLRIGKAATDAPPERSEISSIVVPDGLSLGWTELGMRYELFCRSEVSADLCLHVAESASPLEDIR